MLAFIRKVLNAVNFGGAIRYVKTPLSFFALLAVLAATVVFAANVEHLSFTYFLLCETGLLFLMLLVLIVSLLLVYKPEALTSGDRDRFERLQYVNSPFPVDALIDWLQERRAVAVRHIAQIAGRLRAAGDRQRPLHVDVHDITAYGAQVATNHALPDGTLVSVDLEPSSSLPPRHVMARTCWHRRPEGKAFGSYMGLEFIVAERLRRVLPKDAATELPDYLKSYTARRQREFQRHLDNIDEKVVVN